MLISGGLRVSVHCALFISDDAGATFAALRAVRANVALYVGGMGAAARNYYNTLFTRYGYEREAAEIARRYLSGDKDGAARSVPEEFVRAISLIGTTAGVRARTAALRDAGVTCVLADPVATDHDSRITDMAAVKVYLSDRTNIHRTTII